MTDPRNIAHDKKVQQEKAHRHEEIPHGDHAVQPGKKPHMTPTVEADVADAEADANEKPVVRGPGT
jgi:hypothetical protein